MRTHFPLLGGTFKRHFGIVIHQTPIGKTCHVTYYGDYFEIERTGPGTYDFRAYLVKEASPPQHMIVS